MFHLTFSSFERARSSWAMLLAFIVYIIFVSKQKIFYGKSLVSSVERWLYRHLLTDGDEEDDDDHFPYLSSL
jgi:hypothetical protein